VSTNLLLEAVQTSASPVEQLIIVEHSIKSIKPFQTSSLRFLTSLSLSLRSLHYTFSQNTKKSFLNVVFFGVCPVSGGSYLLQTVSKHVAVLTIVRTIRNHSPHTLLRMSFSCQFHAVTPIFRFQRSLKNALCKRNLEYPDTAMNL
jgi:hypothetical protein